MLKVQITPAGSILIDSTTDLVLLGGAEGCCCLLYGGCRDDQTDFECEAAGGTWLSHFSCEDNECPGACCHHDSTQPPLEANTCEDVSYRVCNDHGGNFQGTGVHCSTQPCHEGLCRQEYTHTQGYSFNHYYYPCYTTTCPVEPCPPYTIVWCTPDTGDTTANSETLQILLYDNEGYVCQATCDGGHTNASSGQQGCFCPPDTSSCHWGTSCSGSYGENSTNDGCQMVDGPCGPDGCDDNCTGFGCGPFNCPYGTLACVSNPDCTDGRDCYVYTCLNEDCSAYCERGSSFCNNTSTSWVECCPQGACCVDPHGARCEIHTQHRCEDVIHGTYQGDGTICGNPPGATGSNPCCECASFSPFTNGADGSCHSSYDYNFCTGSVVAWGPTVPCGGRYIYSDCDYIGWCDECTGPECVGLYCHAHSIFNGIFCDHLDDCNSSPSGRACRMVPDTPAIVRYTVSGQTDKWCGQ